MKDFSDVVSVHLFILFFRPDASALINVNMSNLIPCLVNKIKVRCGSLKKSRYAHVSQSKGGLLIKREIIFFNHFFV